jgi:hypothetical protein
VFVRVRAQDVVHDNVTSGARKVHSPLETTFWARPILNASLADVGVVVFAAELSTSPSTICGLLVHHINVILYSSKSSCISAISTTYCT